MALWYFQISGSLVRAAAQTDILIPFSLLRLIVISGKKRTCKDMYGVVTLNSRSRAGGVSERPGQSPSFDSRILIR